MNIQVLWTSHQVNWWTCRRSMSPPSRWILLDPENGGSKFLRNIGTRVSIYTASLSWDLINRMIIRKYWSNKTSKLKWNFISFLIAKEMQAKSINFIKILILNLNPSSAWWMLFNKIRGETFLCGVTAVWFASPQQNCNYSKPTAMSKRHVLLVKTHIQNTLHAFPLFFKYLLQLL